MGPVMRRKQQLQLGRQVAYLVLMETRVLPGLRKIRSAAKQVAGAVARGVTARMEEPRAILREAEAVLAKAQRRHEEMMQLHALVAEIHAERASTHQLLEEGDRSEPSPGASPKGARAEVARVGHHEDAAYRRGLVEGEAHGLRLAVAWLRAFCPFQDGRDAREWAQEAAADIETRPLVGEPGARRWAMCSCLAAEIHPECPLHGPNRLHRFPSAPAEAASPSEDSRSHVAQRQDLDRAVDCIEKEVTRVEDLKRDLTNLGSMLTWALVCLESFQEREGRLEAE